MWRNISLLAVPLGVGIGLAAACGGSSDSGGGGGGGGGSSSSGGSGGDSGVTCGAQSCGPSEVCCYGSAQPACAAAGSCAGASLSCTSRSTCSSGQSCCFTYAQDDGGGGALGAADFTAECQDSCPSTSYELCATSADCDNGDTCVRGPYARYCSSFEGGAFTFPEGGFTFPDGGFPFPRQDGSAEPPGDGGAGGSDGSVANGASE